MNDDVIDWIKSLDDADLDEVIEEAHAEKDRRLFLLSASEEIDTLTRSLLHARGHREEGEWEHPGTVGFPEGWITMREGRRYESLISHNVWMPGDPDDPQNYRWWKDLTAEEEQGDTEWVGDGVEYHAGDERTYDGQWYRARQFHVSQPGWTPPEVPALWEPIEGPSDG